MSTLLISDLHLPQEASPLREAFLRFLSGSAQQAEALYILGDLFEYWVGDDVGLKNYAPEIVALRELTQSGVPINFQHGNRDFLVGRKFCKTTGVRILKDPVVVSLGGVPTLLSHGDLFCTDDLAYQRWRRITRNPLVQGLFLMRSATWREQFADRARSRSAMDKQTKSDEIMDVNPQAIAQAFKRWNVQRMIHGHTHRPADHRDDLGRERIVLADWRPVKIEALSVDASGCRRISV